MKANRRPDPIRCRDDSGREIVKVATDAEGRRWATLYADDFDRLAMMGLSRTWFFNHSGGGYWYVKAHAPSASGSLVSVARLILEMGPKEVVRYLNGDHLDLRRENLGVRSGWAKRTDAEICGPAKPPQSARDSFSTVGTFTGLGVSA